MAQDPILDESAPLLPNQSTIHDPTNPVHDPESPNKHPRTTTTTSPLPPAPQPPTPKPSSPDAAPQGYPWTAEGFPLTVVGEPVVGRAPWGSGIGSCFGRRDEFIGSDVEVCVLGAVAPCVLHGSNIERLGSAPGNFTNHCMTYAALYLIGNFLYGWNCLAPWLAYRNRSALRRRFNLEGSFESFARTHGCCDSVLDDDVRREQWEAACDLGTHIICHPCALCQEGREIRRRLPHPAFNAQPILVMVPPGQQAMGRDAS